MNFTNYTMRITTFFFFLLCLNTALAQSSILDQKITIEFKNDALDQALKKIQSSSDVIMSFDKNILPAIKIDQTFTNRSIEDILNKLLEETNLSFKLINKTVVIVKSDSQGAVMQKEIEKYTLSGHIYDESNKETLIGVSVFDANGDAGTVSNSYGFYSLSLPEGDYTISYSYLGYDRMTVPVSLNQNQTVDIDLSEMSATLDEIVISEGVIEREEHVRSTEMSVVDLDIETVQKIPALFGEVDVIKALQLLPGVQSVGEGGSGFNVRGGNIDQNLIMLDEAPIYNASHLAGFFSTFNPDAIKDIQFYKGGFPAYYGGRLSSVVDIRMKDGNRKQFGAKGGIGTIMSRLSLEAPLGEKGSFIIAGRRNYLDLLLKAVQNARNNGDSDLADTSFDLYFYDLNAKANYQLDDKNRFFVSGYFGRDVFGISSPEEEIDARVEWGNTTSTFRWNHIYSPKLFSNVTYYFSNYDYFLSFDLDLFKIDWDSRLQEHSLKADFVAYMNPKQTFRFGASGIRYNISPGEIKAISRGRVTEEVQVQINKSIEAAAYVDHEWELSENLKVDAGLRLSSLHNLGPQDVINLDENYEITDTTSYDGGIYNSYWNLEPRFKMRYQLNKVSSIKTSYSRNAQYIQLASNSNYSSPFDIWFSSSELIRPQLADQVVLGYFRNFKDNELQFSFEVFYKSFKNVIDFKDHAELILNENLEAEIRTGRGRAYGMEFQFKKDIGRLTGWLGYTYSKTRRQINTINDGNWYNARYDIPHAINLVATYDLSKRITVAANFNYTSGGAITVPIGGYDFLGTQVPIYSERNGARLPDYHRMDLSLTLRGKKNEQKRFKTEWIFSIYNVYNRKNAFNIRFVDGTINPGTTIAEKTSLFAIVPAITFNFKY
ncbi:MAG: TonB-dependent receptor [Bacteroidota bacterium]